MIKNCESRYSDPYDIIDCLKGLMNRYGRDGMILYRIGLLYENLGNYKKAMEYCKEAKERFPLPRYKSMAEQCYERARSHIWKEESIKVRSSTYTAISSMIIDENTLFVVNCTKTKIWDIAEALGYNNLPEQLPAMLAYQGRSFHEFLLLIREIKKTIGKDIYWVILSAKYGFLLPHELIENYNVTFDQENSIKDHELAEQVNKIRINGNSLSSFKRIYVYTRNNLYYEKACHALNDADECIKLSIIHFPLVILSS